MGLVAKVGFVAYTLALLPQSKIHPTFHISPLKRKLGSHTCTTHLPSVHFYSGHLLTDVETGDLQPQFFYYNPWEISLSKRFLLSSMGFFQIVSKIGLVAYTLAFLPHSKIHHTFHISQLKRKLGSHTTHLSPFHFYSRHLLTEPKVILNRRMVPRKGKVVSQILVTWFHTGPDDSTWPDLEYLQT